MVANVEDFQKVVKENIDTTVQSVGVFSKGVQAIAAEATDYSKKSVEDATKVFEKIVGAKSVDVIVEIQSEYIKKSYEDAVAQATKVSEMTMALAKDLYKPYEAYTTKFQK